MIWNELGFCFTIFFAGGCFGALMWEWYHRVIAKDLKVTYNPYGQKNE